MMADEDFQCDVCQCITFEGEECEYYNGYHVCIMCAIALGM